MARQQRLSTATSAAADEDPEASRSPIRNGRVSTTTTERVVSSFETAPLIFIGVGGSLAVVGSVPLVVTMSLGVNSSATIIGVGFVGFGFLIIVPGLCWCLVSNALSQCRRHGVALPGTRRRRHRHARTLSTEQEVELLVLSDGGATCNYTDAATDATTLPMTSSRDGDAEKRERTNSCELLQQQKAVNCCLLGDVMVTTPSSMAIDIACDNR